MLRDRNLCGSSEEQQKSSILRAVLCCSDQNNNLEVKPYYYLEAICSGLEDLVAGSSCGDRDQLCPYMVERMWHLGECCLYLHKVMGGICGLQVLHSFNQEQRKAHRMLHMATFELDIEKVFAFQASQVKVYSICMEVLCEKPLQPHIVLVLHLAVETCQVVQEIHHQVLSRVPNNIQVCHSQCALGGKAEEK
ncbi:hypothetical protein HGM15179_004963 [Zosterops borbonicus]|uniref:Uncharacterized protein n=1 Tax=Zosterops borbonicus TaxID=364589 RepID=A0A8K1GQS3_9PASS|nr:hypothetical protein HGM15179_004963 [Zosterops borbonicus]